MTVHTSPTGFKRGGDANNNDEKEDENEEEDSSTCSVCESSATTGDSSYIFKMLECVINDDTNNERSCFC